MTEGAHFHGLDEEKKIVKKNPLRVLLPNSPYSYCGDSRVTSISCYNSKENTAITDLPAVTQGEMMEMVNEDHRDKHVKTALMTRQNRRLVVWDRVRVIISGSSMHTKVGIPPVLIWLFETE